MSGMPGNRHRRHARRRRDRVQQLRRLRINLATRRQRIMYAIELTDPFRAPGCGLTAGDVDDQITQRSENR